MDCRNAQLLFSDAEHGRLDADVMAERQRHLAACTPCSRVAERERELTRVLGLRLPSYPAPLALKLQLEARWLMASEPSRSRPPWRAIFVPVTIAATLALALAVGFRLGQRTTRADSGGKTSMAMEAVNDHLRLLDGETPLQVLASDLHQVKPWFAGKLDFAPPLSFKGDSDYPLVGGEVSRFLEQRVAHFVFARRLHKISLFVQPVRRGSSAGEREPVLGNWPALADISRGFAVVGWQSGEFVYLLVSDVNPADLLDLGQRIQSAR